MFVATLVGAVVFAAVAQGSVQSPEVVNDAVQYQPGDYVPAEAQGANPFLVEARELSPSLDRQSDAETVAFAQKVCAGFDVSRNAGFRVVFRDFTNVGPGSFTGEDLAAMVISGTRHLCPEYEQYGVAVESLGQNME